LPLIPQREHGVELLTSCTSKASHPGQKKFRYRNSRTSALLTGIALARVDEYQCAGSSCSGEIGGDLFSLPCKYYCSGAVKVTVSLGYLLCKCQLSCKASLGHFIRFSYSATVVSMRRERAKKKRLGSSN